MKFKLYHFLIIYEIMTFVHEMYKRKARCVRFELQESVGKVNIYIDDSSFKQIDGSIAWRIVKSMYYFISKKNNSNEEFDKDKDFTGTLDAEDFKNFKMTFLPLPKGKCLSYSYVTKPGNIYEVSFSLNSNNIEDLIQEEMLDKNNLNAQYELIFTDEEGISFELETIAYKNNRLRFYLNDNNDEALIKTYQEEDLDSKKKVKELFGRIKIKDNGSDSGKDTKSENDKPEVKKITW